MLQVTGCQAAIVKSTSDAMPFEPFEPFNMLKRWEPPDLLDGIYVTGESLLDAYCITLRVGYLAARWPVFSAPSLQDWKKEYLTKLSTLATTPFNAELAYDADIQWCFKLLRGRKLMRTEDGHIGLAPPGAMQGDRVCVLLGCKSPMLLRAIDSTGQAFRVIGECYVYGLDDTVTILGPLPRDVRVQLDKIPSGYGAVHTYRNTTTSKSTDDDPRLPLLSQTAWKSVPRRERLPDEPALFHYYRNQLTGELLNSDPRLLPEALQARNINTLRKFDLY